MVRAHFRKPSSTFSPVSALVSRNISSVWTENNHMMVKGGHDGSRKCKTCSARTHTMFLDKSVTIFLSEAWSFQEGHLSVCIQVFLVATQNDDDVGASERPCISQPVGQGVIRLSAVRHRWTFLWNSSVWRPNLDIHGNMRPNVWDRRVEAWALDALQLLSIARKSDAIPPPHTDGTTPAQWDCGSHVSLAPLHCSTSCPRCSLHSLIRPLPVLSLYLAVLVDGLVPSNAELSCIVL